MITDEFIAKHKESGTYNEVDEKMKAVDALQGKIHIISSKHEGGKKLNGLSGIAAILRYKLVWTPILKNHNLLIVVWFLDNQVAKKCFVIFQSINLL